MKYRTFAVTVPGLKYESKGWPCQDFSRVQNRDNFQFATVADGHGGVNYFRSQHGAQLAVEAVLNQIRLCSGDLSGDGDVRFGETGIQKFKFDIWQDWRNLVRQHWYQCRSEQAWLGEGEVRYPAVSEAYKAYYENPVTAKDCLYTAYGTTLSFALAIPFQLLLTQIGDGTCVVFCRDGSFRVPIPEEESNFLNVVVSLCEQDAYRRMRHVVLEWEEGSPSEPVAVFLSTDGLDDCYPVYQNEDYLFHLYTVILENILDSGFEATEAELAGELLPDFAARGSTDDISLSYMICEDVSVLREAYDRLTERNRKAEPVSAPVEEPAQAEHPAPEAEPRPLPEPGLEEDKPWEN